MSAKWIRVLGLTTALGGVACGLSWVISPSTNSVRSQPEIVASLVFQVGLLALQVGLLALLAVMWVTEATGPQRTARTVLAAEFVAVVLAIGWTVPQLVDPDRRSTMLLRVLDKLWPISMLGILVVDIMVVGAHRWPAPLRFLPVTAGLLPLVAVSLAWAPAAVRSTMSGIYVATSYCVLGLAMLVRAPGLASLTWQRSPTARSPRTPKPPADPHSFPPPSPGPTKERTP